MTKYEKFQSHICKDPQPGMFRYLAENIRPADTREGEAASGYTHTPEVWERELKLAWASSRLSRIILEDDLKTPMGIYGAVDFEAMPGVGVVWMQGTTAIARHKHSFIKLGRYGVEELKEEYKLLVCYADSRNTLHTRWLRWMGFCPVGVQKLADPEVDFIIFVMPGGCANV